MSSIRILLADDVESWRSSISSMLRTEASFEVVYETSDGLKAVQAAQKLQPAVVLLDIGLPGLNGIQAGAWIPQGFAFARIVFVTMERDPDIVEAAWRLGARGYVLKSNAGGYWLQLSTRLFGVRRSLVTVWMGTASSMAWSKSKDGFGRHEQLRAIWLDTRERPPLLP